MEIYRIEEMANYILSEGHEQSDYFRHCEENGENPLFIKIRSHIFAHATLVLSKGNVQGFMKEHFNSEEVSLDNRVEYFKEDPSLILSLGDEVELFFEELFLKENITKEENEALFILKSHGYRE